MKGLTGLFFLQLRETLTEVHGGAHDRHLPQIEEAYLQQLQRENAALRASLEEHQETLEMIMSTYRQQVGGARGVGAGGFW